MTVGSGDVDAVAGVGATGAVAGGVVVTEIHKKSQNINGLRVKNPCLIS